MNIDTHPAQYNGRQIDVPDEVKFGMFSVELAKDDLITPSVLSGELDMRRRMLIEAERVDRSVFEGTRAAVMVPSVSDQEVERTRRVLVRVDAGTYQEVVVTGTPQLGYQATPIEGSLLRGGMYYDIGNLNRTLLCFIGKTGDVRRDGEPESAEEIMIKSAIRSVDEENGPCGVGRRSRRALGRAAA